MAESNIHKIRVTCKRPHPNPLFIEWMENLYQDAVRDNRKFAKRAKEALESIYKYPLTLNSGSDCAILKGFDRTMCQYLDNQIKEVMDEESRDKAAEDRRKLEMGNTEVGKAEALSSQAQEINIEFCDDGICQPPTRSIPTTSFIKPKPNKRAKNTVDSKVCPPGELNDTDIKINYYEIKSDANSNTITINKNLTNTSLDQELPYKLNVKDSVTCLQCELSASDPEKPHNIYKPAYRTGGYAILLALVEQCRECPHRKGLTKEELIAKAQDHCDISFSIPKPHTNNTAWVYAWRLIKKGLLRIEKLHIRLRDDKNKRQIVSKNVFLLTELGRKVGEELLNRKTPDVTVNDIIFHGQPNDRVPGLDQVIFIKPPPPPIFDEIENSVFIDMPPHTYEIVLLIDKHETAFMDKKRDPISAIFCRYKNFKHEFRSLKVGDFAWVARSKETGRELVLPYIVERKRMDDLGASIKDGRFHEQKFRLRKCGLKHVIYLIEKWGRNYGGLPHSTLMQAIANTSVHDGFKIYSTEGVRHSIKFITTFTTILIDRMQYAYLRGCNKFTDGKELMTFDFFNQATSKNKPLTVREMFIKMLLQLRGLTVEKALTITNKYSTPKALMTAYDKCTEKEGQLLLANLKLDENTRNVGPTVSKTIYMLFTKLEF